MRTNLLLGCVVLLAARVVAAEPPWPTRGWQRSTPEAQGLDAAALAALDAELARGDHGYVDAMLVIRNGHVVFEKAYDHAGDYARRFSQVADRTPGPYNYYDPDWHPYYRHGDLHTMQSVSKSVTSALVGIAIGRGEIRGVDVPALPYFEGYRVGEDARRARWTLKDLLTMTAGIRWDESTVDYTDPANSCARMEASNDWIQFVLDQPMAADPGASFVYNSGVTQLLSQVLRKATGKHADAYAAEQLFRPLGIESFHWKKTPTGHPDTEGGLYLTASDLAKLGYLYARDGVWQGRRVLPAGWVAASTAPLVTPGAGASFRYGYQWWLLPDPARAGVWHWAALGYGGQRLVVVPELDLIAVFTGWNIYEKPALDAAFALKRVLGAVKGTP
jgi:CubicO group peptidase (beta-lactamase class C family)